MAATTHCNIDVKQTGVLRYGQGQQDSLTLTGHAEVLQYGHAVHFDFTCACSYVSHSYCAFTLTRAPSLA